MSGKIERNKKARETKRNKRKDKIEELRKQMEMDYQTERERQLVMDYLMKMKEDWDNQFSEMMLESSCEVSASASAFDPEPRMKMSSASAFDPEPRMKMSSASVFDPEPRMKMSSASAFDPEPRLKMAPASLFVNSIRTQQNINAAREQKESLDFLEELVPTKLDINKSNSNVLQSALRPVKDVTKDLLQIEIDPIAFQARVHYVKTTIIPFVGNACVSTTLFIMTERMDEDQLRKLVENDNFQSRGMYNVEIGTLFKLLGYRHTNEEYATTDVVIPDIVRYSGRYYKEKDYDLFIEQIKSTLKENHVTPLYCYKENDINHVVCIVNLNRDVFIVDTDYEENTVYIPIDELKEYMKDNNFYSIQIFYGAHIEEPDIELPPKREASGKIVGIGPAMSQKDAPPIIRKPKDVNPRKRARIEGGRKYTRRRHKA
jgi:hypothetical protein